MALSCTNNLFVPSRSQTTCVTFQMMNSGVKRAISFQKWGLLQESSALMPSICTLYIQVYIYLYVCVCVCVYGLYACEKIMLLDVFSADHSGRTV
jgi:hypothetical protein